MNPKTGLYEQLIDVMLDGRLRALPGGAFEVQRERVDEAEAHVVLSRYLQKVIRKVLRSLPARNRLENQVALTNRIIALIGELTGDAALGEAALPAYTEMLLAILARLNLPPATQASDLVPDPSPGFHRARSSPAPGQSRRSRANSKRRSFPPTGSTSSCRSSSGAASGSSPTS